MKYILALLLLFVILIIAITLGSQNNQLVSFNFLLAQGEYRLSVLLALLFGGGLLIGWSIASLFYIRLRLRFVASERKLKQIQRQLSEKQKIDRQLTLSLFPSTGKE